MDFGGIVLFGLLAIGLVFVGLGLVVLFIKRSPRRWHGLGLWLGGVAILALLGRILYQVYRLDERLYIAAAAGDAAGVQALLSAGASPDARWEDGTTALEAARRSGHKGVVTMLENAGAEK
jgi:uncharacterized protein